MSKSWRPNNWETYIKEQILFADKTRGISSGFSQEDFEAGADTILKALMSGTVLYVPAGHFLISFPIIQPVDGYWVFIPANNVNEMSSAWPGWL